jgi:hypothetical protein
MGSIPPLILPYSFSITVGKFYYLDRYGSCFHIINLLFFQELERAVYYYVFQTTHLLVKSMSSVVNPESDPPCQIKPKIINVVFCCFSRSAKLAA